MKQSAPDSAAPVGEEGAPRQVAPSAEWRDGLIRLFGWRASLLHGDPCVLDRWNWLRRYLDSGPLRTLDAGCGAGAYTLYAASIGNEAIGLSFDENSNRKARRRATILDLKSVRLLDADLRDMASWQDDVGLVDQIICAETIEHIRDDQKLVADLAALLKPGGKLLLTTPYKHYKHLLGDKLSTNEDGGHVRWGYTHEELRRLLTNAGLVVVREDYVSGIVSQEITNVLRALSKLNKTFAWLVTLPTRLLQLVDAPVTRAAGYPFMCVAVVAIKEGYREG